MYYYFKENVFYLRRDRDALFLKNNFYSVSVNNPNSYTIFKMVLPYLNGSIDFDEEYIGKISNHVIKKFLISLIDILKKNGFVLYSENPININDYSKLEQSFLACYGGKISEKSKRQFELDSKRYPIELNKLFKPFWTRIFLVFKLVEI